MQHPRCGDLGRADALQHHRLAAGKCQNGVAIAVIGDCHVKGLYAAAIKIVQIGDIKLAIR